MFNIYLWINVASCCFSRKVHADVNIHQNGRKLSWHLFWCQHTRTHIHVFLHCDSSGWLRPSFLSRCTCNVFDLFTVDRAKVYQGFPHGWIQRGDRGSGPLWEITKMWISNTNPDPLKIIKLPSQHLMLGHHRPASETPFWMPWWPTYSGIWISSPLIIRQLKKHPPQKKKTTTKKQQQKNKKNFLDARMSLF